MTEALESRAANGNPHSGGEYVMSVSLYDLSFSFDRKVFGDFTASLIKRLGMSQTGLLLETSRSWKACC